MAENLTFQGKSSIFLYFREKNIAYKCINIQFFLLGDGGKIGFGQGFASGATAENQVNLYKIRLSTISLA